VVRPRRPGSGRRVRGCPGRHLPCLRAQRARRQLAGIQYADYFQSYNEAIHRCHPHAAAVSGRVIDAARQWAN